MRILILYFGIAIMLSSASLAQDARVQTKLGAIDGLFNEETGVYSYLGIPFAKPPTGDLRWKASQPAEPWSGVLEAKTFGNRPVQENVWGDMIYRSENMSEDCLYLNVWTPASGDTEGLPVLVYFYGGGFVAGDGSEPRYDGASMAEKGIVALTVNYRLNIFGFYAHPELSAESPYGGSGNYGLLDQNMALQWVQENIAAFGGDPNRVTIAGESAGSISVSAHMASPLSKGLIDGAIGESGAAINPTLFPVPLEEAEEEGERFAENAGYRSLAELRTLSTEELFEAYNQSQRFGFSTTIDGHFYPKSLPEIFNAREQAQTPLLLGWNSAEIPGTAFMQGQPYSEENYIDKVKETYPERHEEVLSLYPHGSEAEIQWSATSLASDRFIAYSTWKWFDLHRKNSDQPVYRYLYSKLRPPQTNPPQNGPPTPDPIGAPHACEIEYAMGNLHLIDVFDWTEDDYKVSETMQNFFANFVKTGNPNGAGLPDWPAAEADDPAPPVMTLDVESRTEPAANDERYRFLDTTYQ